MACVRIASAALNFNSTTLTSSHPVFAAYENFIFPRFSWLTSEYTDKAGRKPLTSLTASKRTLNFLHVESSSNFAAENAEEKHEEVLVRKFPVLGSAEKKELRTFAHQLGKDLVLQQVGKWGVTSTFVTALSDALEANEIVKVKVMGNSPEEISDVSRVLEEKTGAQIIEKVGQTMLLYRPSLTILAKERARKERAQEQKTRQDKSWASSNQRGKPRRKFSKTK